MLEQRQRQSEEIKIELNKKTRASIGSRDGMMQSEKRMRMKIPIRLNEPE